MTTSEQLPNRLAPSGTSGSVCRACGGSLNRAFDAVVLGDVPVTYFRCTRCASLMLPEPHWLDRSYSTVFTPDPDFGAIVRTLFIGRFVRRLRGTRILPWSYRSLDFGSGLGMLVRLQRDRRQDAWGYDRYATPKFAEPYCKRELPPGKFDLVTCIEVIEHTENPVEVLTSFRSMVKNDGLVLVSTELVDGQADLEHWSYLALEHGQHITLFSKAGFTAAVEAAGLEWITTFRLGKVPFIHVLAPKGRSSFALRRAWLGVRQWWGELMYSSDFTI